MPLEDLAREYNVQLVPSGKRLKGLCPFHAEKTPSFSIDVERQLYYCFGCHAGGDLFAFIKSMHHVDYPQALELLARRAGVVLEYAGGGGRAAGPREDRLVELYDAMDFAQRYYHEYLLHDPSARPAREYLKRRGIETAQWERFQLGFSPPEWDSFLRQAHRKGLDVMVLEKAGLARRREHGGGHYDYFRGRVMFPVQDPQGRAIGFGARTLGDDQPKYLNTPKTTLFDKSQVLYGLSQARTGIQRESKIAIVEGYTDAIMAHQAGLDFFVASLGTAFTQENARRLSRLAPEALLVFDGDAAGQKATERSLELLVAESLDVRIYSVTDGKDPCDAITLLGGQEFRRRLEAEAVGIFEFKWRRTMQSGGIEAKSPTLRAKALDELLSLLALVPNVVARKLYVREFSERVGIPERDIDTRMGQISKQRQPFRGEAVRSPGPATADAGRKYGGPNGEVGIGSELEAIVLECLLALPHKAGTLWSRIPPGLFRSPLHRTLADSMGRQLQGAADLNVTRLTREVDDPGVQQLLLGLLSRLEDDDGAPRCDYEEVWSRAERDLLRQVKKMRLQEIKQILGRPDPGEPLDRLQALQREYRETLKDLKRG